MKIYCYQHVYVCLCECVPMCLFMYFNLAAHRSYEVCFPSDHWRNSGKYGIFFLCKLLLLVAFFWWINLYKTVSINWFLIQLQPLKMSQMKVRVWFLPLSLMLGCEIWTEERKVLLFMKELKMYWNSFSSLIFGHLLWFTSENPRLFTFKPGLLQVSHSAMSLFPCKAKFVAVSLCKGTF